MLSFRRERTTWLPSSKYTQNILHPDVRTEQDREQGKENKECHVAAPKEIPTSSRRLSVPADLYVLLLLAWLSPRRLSLVLNGWIRVEIYAQSSSERESTVDKWFWRISWHTARTAVQANKCVIHSFFYIPAHSNPVDWVTTKLSPPL